MYKSNEIVVSDVLKDLGISPNLKGYHYARSAICRLLEDTTHTDFTNVYYHIADEFNSTYSKVERCIRFVVDKMMLEGDHDLVIKIFGHCASKDTGRLTNSQFVFGIVDYIRTYLSV